MTRAVNVILSFLCIVFATNCDVQPIAQDHSDLAEYFNRKGRYPRFANSDLIFGDTINPVMRALLQLDSSSSNEKIYRKAAYQFSSDPDSIVYFMYGLSMKDSVLNEVRIRSFKKDTLIGDFLIVNLDKDHSLNYDYWYDDDYLLGSPGLIVKAMNSSQETHYSFYKFYQGKIINTTMVPDTIFRRHDLLTSIGQRIEVYNDFEDKTLTISDKKINVRGSITQLFRGEDCENHMVVLLDDSLTGFNYIYLDETLSDISNLYGVKSDRLIEGEEACLKVTGKTYDKIILIKEKVYVDYK